MGALLIQESEQLLPTDGQQMVVSHIQLHMVPSVPYSLVYHPYLIVSHVPYIFLDSSS